MGRALNHVSTRFGKIAYTEQGHGPAALFVHGVFMNGHLWRQPIERLKDMRRCIAVDLLAHGGTQTSPDQDVSFDSQAEMLEAVCAELNLEKVDVVANDSGGGIAQIFACRYPNRIRSLTLTNCDVHDNWPPLAFQSTVNDVANGLLGQVAKQMLANPEFARTYFSVGYEHPERLTTETMMTFLEPIFSSEAGIRGIERFFASIDCSVTVAIEPQLRRLEIPTLIVWATGDQFFDVKWAYWLRDAIPGARDVVEIEGAKLFFPDERPDELANAIRTLWLDTAPADAIAAQ